MKMSVREALAAAEKELGDGPLAGEAPMAWAMRLARAQYLITRAQIATMRGLLDAVEEADAPEFDRVEEALAAGRERSLVPPVAERWQTCGYCLGRHGVGNNRFAVHVNSSGLYCTGSLTVAP